MNSRFEKTNAIVLNSVKFGEGHKIVTLYSESYGKIEASAFGARKTKSRFGSMLEPFTVAQFLLYRKNDESLFAVREAEVHHSNSGIRADLYRFILGSCMVEPLFRFVEMAETDRKTYNLLAESLRALCEIEIKKGMYLLSMYDVKLLGSLGYGPDVRHCRRCEKSVKPGEPAFADPSCGVLLCRACRTVSSITLTEGAVRFIDWAQTHEVGDAHKVTMKSDTLAGVRNAVEWLYLSTFHKKPQSWRQLSDLPANL